MKTLLNFSLLLLALILLATLGPLGLLYALIQCLFRLSIRRTIAYFSELALSLALNIDLLGNVLCQDLFNAALIKPDGYRFGNNVETISAVLGRNKAQGTLTDLGRALANLLNWIDPGHVEKAV